MPFQALRWDISDGMVPVAVGPASILAQEISDACLISRRQTARSLLPGVWCSEFTARSLGGAVGYQRIPSG